MTANALERRCQKRAGALTFREPPADGPGTLSGRSSDHASSTIASRTTWAASGIRLPGAFAGSLGSEDLRFCHHPEVLGRESAGTLTVTDSPAELAFEILLPDMSFARDLVVSVRRGDISGMSFGFVVVEDEWAWRATTASASGPSRPPASSRGPSSRCPPIRRRASPSGPSNGGRRPGRQNLPGPIPTNSGGSGQGLNEISR